LPIQENGSTTEEIMEIPPEGFAVWVWTPNLKKQIISGPV
jgi:hypothetical protein